MDAIVVGIDVAKDRPHGQLALAALCEALVVRRPSAGLIQHSDGGNQYCSIDQSWLGKSGPGDEWSFGPTASKIAVEQER